MTERGHDEWECSPHEDPDRRIDGAYVGTRQRTVEVREGHGRGTYRVGLTEQNQVVIDYAGPGELEPAPVEFDAVPDEVRQEAADLVKDHIPDVNDDPDQASPGYRHD